MSALEEMAQQFAYLDHEITGATSYRRTDLLLQWEATRHDLKVLSDVPCGCEPGTCQGLITRCNVGESSQSSASVVSSVL